MATDRMNELHQEFLDRHRYSHYLVVDKRSGNCIGAIYYAPDWEMQKEVIDERLRVFFELVREAEFRAGAESRNSFHVL